MDEVDTHPESDFERLGKFGEQGVENSQFQVVEFDCSVALITWIYNAVFEPNLIGRR